MSKTRVRRYEARSNKRHDLGGLERRQERGKNARRSNPGPILILFKFSRSEVVLVGVFKGLSSSDKDARKSHSVTLKYVVRALVPIYE